jgi:hypothetical protein
MRRYFIVSFDPVNERSGGLQGLDSRPDADDGDPADACARRGVRAVAEEVGDRQTRLN